VEQERQGCLASSAFRRRTFVSLTQLISLTQPGFGRTRGLSAPLCAWARGRRSGSSLSLARSRRSSALRFDLAAVGEYGSPRPLPPPPAPPTHPTCPFLRSPVRPFARSPVRSFARSPVRPFPEHVASPTLPLARARFLSPVLFGGMARVGSETKAEDCYLPAARLCIKRSRRPVVRNTCLRDPTSLPLAAHLPAPRRSSTSFRGARVFESACSPRRAAAVGAAKAGRLEGDDVLPPMTVRLASFPSSFLSFSCLLPLRLRVYAAAVPHPPLLSSRLEMWSILASPYFFSCSINLRST
jgi:hypothetical protein